MNIPADKKQEMEEHINIEEGLSRVRGNEKLYVTLLKSFSKNTYMDELVDRIAAKDFESAAKTAHTIKGVAANLSFTRLYELMKSLELELKEGTCSESILNDVKDAVAKTLGLIEVLAS